MPLILVVGPILYVQDELAAAGAVHCDCTTRAELIAACAPGGRYAAMEGIYRTNGSAATVGPFNAELIAALPPAVRFLAQCTAGYDMIDVDACTARGIQVCNTASAVDDATATAGMYLIISALRGFSRAERKANEGLFKGNCLPGHDPEGKVLGIIGLGGIGRALAKRAILGFDMKVVYTNRRPVPDDVLAQFPAGSVTFVPVLEDLLAQSDVVSISIPLGEHTRNFFDASKFSAMKKGSCFLNTGRGGLVDEEALIAALSSGHLGSAGLDVFPNEPNINPVLLKMDNVAILPHMGTETYETQRKMELLVLENLQCGFRTGRVSNLVPDQAGKM